MLAKFTQICKRTCIQNHNISNKIFLNRAFSTNIPKKGLDQRYKKNIEHKTQIIETKTESEKTSEDYELEELQSITKQQFFIGTFHYMPFITVLAEYFTNSFMMSELQYVPTGMALYSIWNVVNYSHL